jgi:tetratricopeptide (TPR) repeat protein
MPRTDRYGLPVTASSDETVARWEHAVDALLHFRDDVGEVFEHTVADAPDFALGHIGRALLRSMSTERPDALEAAEILEPLGHGKGLAEREQRLLAAARAYAAGDLSAASERLARHTIEYPSDAFALAVGHQVDFFTGDAISLGDRIGRALSAWDEQDPQYGFLLGMLAFGLEECGLYDRAEAAGLAALEHDRRDVWAVHAVAHVHEMRAAFADGSRFLASRREDWAEGNFLNVHNSWHLALFQLEAGDSAGPLGIYDQMLHNADSTGVALEMLDASALLWRLHLDGIDVGGRWRALADAWAAKADQPFYSFNDAHAAMALVGAGRLDDARALVERLERYVADSAPHSRETNLRMTADVGLPVSAAIVAFGEGRHADVIERLHPIRGYVNRFGGSHAQRDAVARTLLEAALRGGQYDLARALLSERLVIKEASPYNWAKLAQLRWAEGDELGARKATSRVDALRAAA